ncbi:MAG TPA: MerR family DNA-binding transcriptional regulator [Propionibacteriaceae bacterium]|nr:MerR family DNA-binding transcriptional regulator [Propionibacteriaceae bacterium]
MTQSTWTIGELAEEFGITLRAIRFYEDKGLLRPERSGQSRVFTARDRVRLQLVLRGKRLGFSLEETGRVLDMYDEQPGELGQLRFLLADIAQRRGVLTRRRQDLDEAMAELDELEQRCRLDLERLSATSPPRPADP